MFISSHVADKDFQIEICITLVNCLQFNIRYEKVERPAPVGGALVDLILIRLTVFMDSKLYIFLTMMVI
jgi:hypothetical protein